jgi:hypothetical protein
MPRERPTAILVMAILNFVFGGLYILFLICGGISIAVTAVFAKNMPTPKGQPNPFEEVTGMYDAIPGFYAFTATTSTLMLLFCILLVVAGIGLLKMQPWARWACIVYAAYTLFAASISLMYNLALAIPAMQQWRTEYMAKINRPVPASPLIDYGSAALGFVFGIAYAVALLIVMFRPSVVRAFAGERSAGPNDYDDRR